MNSKLKGPIFTARSFDEYIKMFNLDIDKLKNKNILDCAAGASSFTSQMTKREYEVKALDLMYDKDPLFLKETCQKHLDALIDGLTPLKDHFKWNYFKDLGELKKHRLNAQNDFIEDYTEYRDKKYIKGDLNKLPFKDNAFSLILCSHLLFIYDHRLSYDFHLNSINEMIRVADEVRIYPLVKHRAIKSAFVKRIEDDLMEKADITIEKVNYEFRKGGNQMMKLNRNNLIKL